MTDNNQIPNTEENTDLARQYQNILDKYSQELGKQPSALQPPPPTPEPQKPSLSPESALPTPPPTLDQFTSASTDNNLPTSSNLFKYIFFFSLFIFLGVIGTLVYTLFKSPAGPSATLSSPTPLPEVSPSPVSGVCELNDNKYPVGESFPAADGCNTCTCQSDLTIVCTENTCDPTQ